MSPQRLSHFAALTECLTCFSASIGHISQGEAGVVDTGGSHRHVVDASKHRVFELRSSILTFSFGNKCFCLYIFEWGIKICKEETGIKVLYTEQIVCLSLAGAYLIFDIHQQNVFPPSFSQTRAERLLLSNTLARNRLTNAYGWFSAILVNPL